MLRVEIDGALKIFDPAGTDITPRGGKARGLIALLLTGKDFTRARRFLQDKLWSTRAQEQGSASLRQALSEIRRDLGPHRDALVCTRGNVQLDPDLINLVPPSSSQDSELFEDVDVRDPEFENWIRDLRAQHSAAPLPAPRDVTSAPVARHDRPCPVVVFRSPRTLTRDQQWIYAFIREQVIGSAAELGEIECADLTDEGQPELTGARKPWLFLTIDISSIEGRAFVAVQLEDATSRIQWRSALTQIDTPDRDESFFAMSCLSNHACEAIGRYLSSGKAGAGTDHLPLALAMMGREQIFDFSRDALRMSDRLLAQAYALDPQPVYAAWRAFVRNTAMFEHLTQDFLPPLDNEDVVFQALRDDPQNSMVLAFAAQHSFVHLRDPEYGQFLCARSIEANDANPIAWAFRANYQTALGQYDDAIGSAERGLALASGRAEQHFCMIFSCMARIGVADYARATSEARLTSVLSPDFIAIRRFLYALHRASNRLELADKVRDEIRTREPHFDNGTLFDPSYPVGTLRGTPIMELL